MASDSGSTDTRFPWGFFVASLLPIGLAVAAFVLPAVFSTEDSMGLGMACVLLAGPVGGLVTVWGLVRLWLGDARRFPALRRLVWFPALVGSAVFAVG